MVTSVLTWPALADFSPLQPASTNGLGGCEKLALPIECCKQVGGGGMYCCMFLCVLSCSIDSCVLDTRYILEVVDSIVSG
jgi:hypothetical protein